MLSVLVSVMEMANRHFIRSSNKHGLANNLFQFMEPHIMVGSPRAPRTISIIFFSYPSHPCQRSCISCSSCLGFKTKNSLYSCRRPRVGTKGPMSHMNESFLRQSSLREIMKAISINLTTGKLHALGKDEAQASNDVSQIVLDCLSCNIRMEGVLVREELNFKWHSEG